MFYISSKVCTLFTCVHFSEVGRNCGSLCRSNMTLLMVFLTLRNISFETWCIPLFPGIFSSKKEKQNYFFVEWSQNWKGRRGIAIWGNYCQHFAKIDFISNTWNVILYSSMKKRLLAMWVRSNKDGAFIEGNQWKNLKYITQKNNYTNLSLLPFYSL